MHTLTLPLPPSINRRFKPTAHNPYTLTESVRTFKAHVALLALEHDLTPLTGKLFAQVDLFRPADRGDADNYTKVLFDSLEGILYHKDAQIKRYVVSVWVDKTNPRTIITVCEYTPTLYHLPIAAHLPPASP